MSDKTPKRKSMSRKAFWLNILAMLILVGVAIFLTFRWMNAYTQHGRAIIVPDVTNVTEEEAVSMLSEHDLVGISYDKAFEKGVPAGVVIAQRPLADAKVKRGRSVYLTISSGSEPMVALPDLADNSSLRQASSQLRASGFALTANDTITGEADWVYKVLYKGREMRGGDLVPVGATLTLVVGNGEKPKEEAEELPAEVEEEWF